MDKSVLESFISNLESAGVKEFSIRFEGGNRVATHNEDSKIFLQGEYALAIECKNNHGAKSKAVFNATAIPYDNIDDAKSYDLTTKELIDFLNAEGIDISEEETNKFISTHGNRVRLASRTEGGYYEEVHNEKGQAVFTTPLSARITTSNTKDKEGVVEIDKDSPVK